MLYYPIFKTGQIGYKALKKVYKGAKKLKSKANLTEKAEKLRSSGYTKIQGGVMETPGYQAKAKRIGGDIALGTISRTKKVGKHVRKYHKEYSSAAGGYTLGSFLAGDDID